MLFSERITEAVRQSNLTQKQVAEKLNIAESNITNWKKGENLPSVDILYKICILLDESADYLLGIEDESGARITQTKYNIGTINNSGKLNMK